MEPERRERFIGTSRPVQDMLDLCVRVAAGQATVLVHGETGTGKELVARLIHRLSPRREGPFEVCYCAAVPEGLLESELFGHEKGAFTGAERARAGLFERAHGGTLLLDEVGDIPPAAQAKLLRVLQERRFSRLGGTQTQEADVRIVATTRYDLAELVREGRFREDLYYRLSVFPVHVPPLRARREDVPLLARHFLEWAAGRHRCGQQGITDVAMAVLVSYDWPGNVRQLQAVVERALLLAQGEPIRETHLPAELLEGFVPPAEGESASSLSYTQRLLVSRALHRHDWNFSRAAQHLGVSVHVLRQMAGRLGLRRGK